MLRCSLQLLTAATLLSIASCAPSEPRSTPTANSPDAPPAGFSALFDGESFAGWWACEMIDPRALAAMNSAERAAKVTEGAADLETHWTIVDGVIVNDGQGRYLTTERDFDDFELQLEYRTVAGADSGIYLRGVPQVQIWDTTEAGGKWEIGAKLGSGGLWNNAAGAPGRDPLVHADRPFGEWNQVRIVMIGERVSVWLNDQAVVTDAPLANYFDRTKPVPRSGPIQLQTHGGEIAWRRIWIREIAAEEANRLLAERVRTAGAGWSALFDGATLGGWRGSIDGYQVSEGAIRCREGSGGTLYHETDFRDFEVQFEFRLPSGGNNGLAIRYPGTGDSAYVGMCELQVLDNTAGKYAELDPRQYHGSAYGMVAAHRGYLRSPGMWNHQRVRVAGSTIEVELNGTRILNADLSTVTEGLAPVDRYRGRTRTHGFFGFAGHGDAVSFRKIEARHLTASAAANPSSSGTR